MIIPENLKRTLEHCVNNCEKVECCEDECPYVAHCSPGNIGVMAEVPIQVLRDCIVYIDQVEGGLDRLDATIDRLYEQVVRLDDKLKGCGL